jgi:transcriptional regulator with XRE-family HTH domain
MDVIKRIDELRLLRGWTINRLAYEAALPQSSVATMFERKTPPKLELLQSLCDAFGITLAQFFSAGETSVSVTEEENRLLELYRSLSQKKRKAVLAILENDN